MQSPPEFSWDVLVNQTLVVRPQLVNVRCYICLGVKVKFAAVAKITDIKISEIYLSSPHTYTPLLLIKSSLSTYSNPIATP